MKSFYKFCIPFVAVALLAGCRDHEPQAEDLPTEAVSFVYSIPGDYALDYYVDSEIEFVNTSSTQGTAMWSFGDGESAEGDTVRHAYATTSTYTVVLSIKAADGTILTKKQPLFISDITPLLTMNPIEGGVCEVLSSQVTFSLELPNPKERQEDYAWIFPEGTTWADGSAITDTVRVRIPEPVIFSNVGSQTVRLQTKLDGRALEEVSLKVPVGYNQDVPTLYYAVRGGNIMALKLASDAPEGMKIMPFDLGVSSGQHPFNILFADSSLYVLDAGKQFYYVDDADGVLGDGKISVISKDGTKVETLLSNVGQAAFDDPFYGYIEDGVLYFSNRNTGIVAVNTKDRNRMYSKSEFPYFVEHATLEYYKNGWDYGCIGGMLGKVEGTWYWCKFYNGNGIFRFTDGDILKSATAQGVNAPAAGIALKSMKPKSFAYNSKTKEFFFTVFDVATNGFYRCPTIADLDAISKQADLAPYKVMHASGKGLEVNVSGSPALYEGTVSEVVGVTQLVVDETTGCVYFGYRNPGNGDVTNAPSGLMRYNPATGKVETVIEGVEIYGVTINPNPSKLF